MEVAETKKLKVPKLRFREFEDGWIKTTVGEATKFKNGKGHEQAIDESGDFVVVNSKFISTQGGVKKYTSEQICPLNLGDIVMVMSDVPRGKALAKCYYIESDGVYSLNQRICGLSSKKNETKFLIHVINRNQYYLMFDSGVGQTNLRKDEVLDCPIYIPSLPEQKKIADFLSAIDARIQHLNRKKERLETYKKGVMQRLFPSTGSGQVPELRFKQADGTSYPDWEEKRLGEIADIQGGGTPDTTKPEYWDGGIPWYTPTEIVSRTTNGSKRTISELGLKNSSASILPIGTILFTSRATIGAMSFASEECTTNQGFMSIMAKSMAINEYLYYWIQMNQKVFIRKSQGSTFLEISKTEMRKIPLVVPCKEEQQKIADFLSSLDKKIAGVNAQIEKTQQFKKGLLQQMFV